MVFEDDRVLWGGQTAVVRVAAEIDATNAEEIRSQLLSVVNQGASVMVVDMSKTTFCDSAGVSALVRAFRRATESGTKFRLVVTSPSVERVLQITGVDRLIDTYPTVTEALGSEYAD
ncbi:MAG TPA: STAS domain-containing protein [Steroidobacteraceae bacterium]|nr:STAS domain-containing protein [Steroidobacteraceae bacterium]